MTTVDHLVPREEAQTGTMVAIRGYLDNAIKAWRTIRDDDRPPVTKARAESVLMAPHYIDAFQSVRVSLFGETLPIE